MTTMTNEAYWVERLVECDVPEHMHGGYVLYILHGVPPGSFAQAVLENNLREACLRADDINQRALFKHVRFLYAFAPAACWGSPEKVHAWITRHQRPSADSEVASAVEGSD